jgi:ribosomal protein L37AE/L43A
MNKEIKKYLEEVKAGKKEFQSLFKEQNIEDIPKVETQYICPNCLANNAEILPNDIAHCNNCGWEDKVAVFTAMTAETRNRENNTY